MALLFLGVECLGDGFQGPPTRSVSISGRTGLQLQGDSERFHSIQGVIQSLSLVQLQLRCPERGDACDQRSRSPVREFLRNCGPACLENRFPIEDSPFSGIGILRVTFPHGQRPVSRESTRGSPWSIIAPAAVSPAVAGLKGSSVVLRSKPHEEHSFGETKLSCSQTHRA